MPIFGINEGINSSVVVLEKGRVIFALQEERVTKKKNYMGFPSEALKFTLKHLSINAQDVEAICLSNLISPLVTKEKFLGSYDKVANEGPVGRLWRRNQSRIPGVIRKVKKSLLPAPDANAVIDSELQQQGFRLDRIQRTHHHFNHAASVYYGLRKNSKEPHLVMTLDGGGDDACSHIYLAQGNHMELIAKTPIGHSIGNVYSRITHFMGMVPHEHEYKLMGLSAYSSDRKYVQPVIDKLRKYVDLDPSNPLCFKSQVPELTYAVEPRIREDFLSVRFDNLAAAIQLYTEELLERWVKAAVAKTGVKKVLAAGGVFMNVKANKLIAELDEVEYFDVFPSCGDETLPFGGAWHYYATHSPKNGDDIVFDSFCLGPGPSFDLAEIRKKFADKLDFKEVIDPEAEAAQLLARGEIVARCSGPMEFGARALGNRSLLADPKSYEVVTEINKMIKLRDFWMPFAPAMAFERIHEYIRVPKSLPENVSPYMMQTFETTDLRGLFAAGVHAYDKTARAQIVNKEINPGFHRLISEFDKLTGKAVLLNTSYNMHGDPLVFGAADAVHVLLKTTLKYLFIDNVLITKKSTV
jgi:carbamoyltransferase